MDSSSSPLPKNPNLLDELEDVYRTHRLEVVKPDGFLVTPLHIIKSLAQEHDMKIHQETYLLQAPWYGEDGDNADLKNRTYRVELLCGSARGIGQAPVSGLATQLAAVNMIEKMKHYAGLTFPKFGLPPGSRISPFILSDLKRLCQSNELDNPYIEIKRSDKPFAEQEQFDCIISVGQLRAVARSDSHHMARRMACHNMWNQLAVTSYPMMPTAMGSDCLPFSELRRKGIEPLMSATKLEWMVTNRRDANGAFQYLADEPDDADDPEHPTPRSNS